MPNRTPQERRDGLQDRLASREDFRDGAREDWQDHRDDIRQDWQDRYDDFYDRHEDWHHGCWNEGGWWDHMWEEHTALAAFGVTMWGLNAAAYGFGYWGYENPYYTESYPVDSGVVLDYSQPLTVEAVDPAAATATEQPAVAEAPGMADFDAARQAFQTGDYAAALASTNKALSHMPSDPIIHEFRALVLFAQGKYHDAAAGLYSVLSTGPGWDWTTLSSLYPSVDTYTKQLRALETHVKQNPNADDARFVLAYHYLSCGSKDVAAGQYKQLYAKNQQDMLVKQLLLMTGGPDAIGAQIPAEPAATPTAGTQIDGAQLVGTWTAASKAGAKFNLQLTQDGSFTWTFSEKGKQQAVKGVYAIDGNVLAMEPETGGTMLAELSPPRDSSFGFQVLGAPPGDPGLTFKKTL